MNSLNFINKEIEQNKSLVKRYTNHLLAFPSSIIESRLEEIKEELTYLQQIKSKLEIMELIENGWSSIEQTVSGEKIIKFEKLNLDDWLKVWKKLEEITLKKALEVGNNHE